MSLLPTCRFQEGLRNPGRGSTLGDVVAQDLELNQSSQIASEPIENDPFPSSQGGLWDGRRPCELEVLLLVEDKSHPAGPQTKSLQPLSLWSTKFYEVV